MLDRVLSRTSTRMVPGPPPDGGWQAWIICESTSLLRGPVFMCSGLAWKLIYRRRCAHCHYEYLVRTWNPCVPLFLHAHASYLTSISLTFLSGA